MHFDRRIYDSDTGEIEEELGIKNRVYAGSRGGVGGEGSGLEVDRRKIVTAKLTGNEFRLYTEEQNNVVTCYACEITTEFDINVAVIRQETLKERNNG